MLDRTSVAVGTSTAGLTWMILKALQWYQERQRVTWLEVGEVEKLLLYPLKSAGAMSVNQLDCTELGASYGPACIRDRAFIVYRVSGSCLTGLKCPKQNLIRSSVSGSVLTLTTFNGEHTFQLDTDTLTGSDKDGVDCGDAVAAWLSTILTGEPTGLRLRFYPQLDTRYYPKNKKEGVDDYFDWGILHLISQASMTDLNSRCSSPIQPLQFRPNILVKGPKLIPYEEDSWIGVRIGTVTLRYRQPALRYRGLRDALKRKKWGEDPVFGAYLNIESVGKICVGDKVYIAV